MAENVKPDQGMGRGSQAVCPLHVPRSVLPPCAQQFASSLCQAVCLLDKQFASLSLPSTLPPCCPTVCLPLIPHKASEPASHALVFFLELVPHFFGPSF
eukprot:1160915-Pelagomonas_calceolata.AAC.18